jgi:hypothetical protein
MAQVIEQRELASGQVHGLSVDADLSGQPVESNPAELDHQRLAEPASEFGGAYTRG